MDSPLRNVGGAVKRLQVRHHRAMAAKLAPLGITPVQWDALRHLHDHPTASLHDLAGLTFQTDQAFGALAARMLDNGLIERVPGPGRAVRHRITPKGESLRNAGNDVVEDVLQASFASLDPAELRQFADLLARLLPPPPTLPLPGAPPAP